MSLLLLVSLVTTLVVGSALAAWSAHRLGREVERTRRSLVMLRAIHDAHATLAAANARAARSQEMARAAVPPAGDR